MTNIQRSIFTCTTCSNTFEISFSRNYKSTDQPSIKKKIFSDKLFKFPCPHCNDVFDIEYEFTYHNPEKKYILWLQLPYEGKTPFPTLPPYKMYEIAPKEYKYRIVNSREELAEKIAIFDSNLDDKVIESIKADIIANRNYADFPIKDMHFYTLMSDIDPEEFSDDLGFNVSYYGLPNDVTIVSRSEYLAHAKLMASVFSEFLMDICEWEKVDRQIISNYEKMKKQNVQEIIDKWKEVSKNAKNKNTSSLLYVVKKIEKSGQILRLFFGSEIIVEKAEKDLYNITEAVKNTLGFNYIIQIKTAPKSLK